MKDYCSFLEEKLFQNFVKLKRARKASKISYHLGQCEAISDCIDALVGSKRGLEIRNRIALSTKYLKK